MSFNKIGNQSGVLPGAGQTPSGSSVLRKLDWLSISGNFPTVRHHWLQAALQYTFPGGQKQIRHSLSSSRLNSLLFLSKYSLGAMCQLQRRFWIYRITWSREIIVSGSRLYLPLRYLQQFKSIRWKNLYAFRMAICIYNSEQTSIFNF